MIRILSAVLWAFLCVVSIPSSEVRNTAAVTAFAPSLSRHHQKLKVPVDLHVGQLRTLSLPKIPSVRVVAQSPASARTTCTSLPSAKVLPFVYTGFSGALLYKATRLSTDCSETIVLVAVSALSFLNLGPSDNARLASAKRAYKKTEPASAGKEKQARQAALTWKKAVRIKIIGQVIGLGRMVLAKECRGVMKGAAWVMGATLAFLMAGGGSARHDDMGNLKPIPEKALMGIMTIDAILFAAALLAAEPSSSLGFVAAVVYAAGVSVGSLEGVPQFLKAMKGNKSN
ncbi:unnamed protein product [Pseudo-nitzschia multistriata]|uniref:Uncharacterized protein n=1 Tax=Pseudo-nitzschia multistriata TaxID=183589 RepID=A0A448YV50_9STRA|nr:unnamed protein product [Pseudo-nitzschia multistriata]